jgi:hypothetical protein
MEGQPSPNSSFQLIISAIVAGILLIFVIYQAPQVISRETRFIKSKNTIYYLFASNLFLMLAEVLKCFLFNDKYTFQ